MKTYVIIISQNFPKGHVSQGEKTGFVEKIKIHEKIHTIRHNYGLWARRIENVQRGVACISVRIWTGNPYRSKQREIFNFTDKDNVGIERIKMVPFRWLSIEGLITKEDIIAKNDGLRLIDFQSWFRELLVGDELAIIHFSGFRYRTQNP